MSSPFTSDRRAQGDPSVMGRPADQAPASQVQVQGQIRQTRVALQRHHQDQVHDTARPNHGPQREGPGVDA